MPALKTGAGNFPNSLILLCVLHYFILVRDSLHNLCLYLVAKFGVILEQGLCGITSLCELAALVREPRTAFLYDAVLHAEVDKFANL